MKKSLFYVMLCAIIILVIALGVVVYLWQCPAKPPVNDDSLVYWDKVKVGDKFDKLTVTSVTGWNEKQKISEDSAKIKFSGESMVQGKYNYYVDDASGFFTGMGCVSFLEKDNKVPLLDLQERFRDFISEQERNLNPVGGLFCFDNNDSAVKVLGKKNRDVKIAINNYQLIYAGAEVTNLATFVKEIK